MKPIIICEICGFPQGEYGALRQFRDKYDLAEMIFINKDKDIGKSIYCQKCGKYIEVDIYLLNKKEAQ